MQQLGLHVGSARLSERVQINSSPNKTPSNMVNMAMFSIRCGIIIAFRKKKTSKVRFGAAAVTDLLQIDACKQSIMRWGIWAGAFLAL